MTSMQMDRAINDGILVPWRKNEPEKAKTALQLLTVDKGGLTFQPKIGEHENVAEIDFASMYPSLMVTRNISPETVLCSCCRNDAVPEAGYNICEKRRGLIPLTLEPLVERRKLYKQLMKSADERTRVIYDARRAAIKWMLVTCFGYMGYKNARMGRIEAHEAVTAWGRETLLRAKEIAEDAGFEMLHALTDSLWIEKEGITEEELSRLCEMISMRNRNRDEYRRRLSLAGLRAIEGQIHATGGGEILWRIHRRRHEDSRPGLPATRHTAVHQRSAGRDARL